MLKIRHIISAAIAMRYAIIFVIMIAIISSIVIIGCTDNFAVKKDYDFEMELLPVPSTIKINEQVEMRFTIIAIDGSYDSTKYYLRYFQYAGKGTLADEAGQVFAPNDAYLLTKKIFRLYFTPTLGTQQQLELTFYDSFNHKHPVELTFAIEEDAQ
jgi:hypothetical protein